MQGLAIRCELAAPTKFITLTCWTKAYLGPRNAYDRMRPKVSELFRRIRKQHTDFECMKVLEAHANGFPHWHIVARCGYIPQAWLSDQWRELAQSPIVDIRRVEQIRSVYAYVLKYLGKQTSVPWTNRRISYTRKFFPPKEKNPNAGWELHSKARSKQHPVDWLYDRARGEEIEQLTPTAWLLEATASDERRRLQMQ